MSRGENPGLRLSTILLAGLALSIGWGVRGNFGHEFGAMLPGALAAIAVCLMSGREDWRRRVAYFAFFGALGWGFGGSISYGQVIAYTHSGQAASQFYGFAMLFVIGFLWGGMGGAGTAFPAVATRERIELAMVPLLWIFGAWWLWDLFGGVLIERWMSSGADSTWQRHLDPLYWFDTDWVAAFLALVAVAAYALCHESLKFLSPNVVAGAMFGFVAFFLQYYLGFHAFWFVPGAAVVGVDNSSAALSVAAVNAARLGLDVKWVWSDVLTDDLASTFGVQNVADDGFDVLVSNPPYVAETERKEVAPDVLAFEPSDALFVSGDPLAFYRRIIAESVRVLRPGGLLVFEVHEDRADKVAATMREAGYANPTVRDDHAGRSRVVASALEVRPT